MIPGILQQARQHKEIQNDGLVIFDVKQVAGKNEGIWEMPLSELVPSKGTCGGIERILSRIINPALVKIN